MPTARQSTRSTEGPTSANGAGKFVPKRSATATAIPSKTTKASAGYTEWASEVDDLRANLGSAYSYDDVPNVQTVAQGIRRTYGIHAVTRGFDKETKRGTLWLEFPSKHENAEDENSPLVPDETQVAEIKATYHKSA